MCLGPRAVSARSRPVYVNEGLTLDFDQLDGHVPVQHFCFRVSEVEFDRIVGRLAARGIAYRSTPHGPVDMQVNKDHGGRIVYWSVPDGHVWEALTVSYARPGDVVTQGIAAESASRSASEQSRSVCPRRGRSGKE